MKNMFKESKSNSLFNTKYLPSVRALNQNIMGKQLKGYKPVMLLDDIFDKLDNKRVEQIIKLTSDDNFGQVFITDTQRERIGHMLHEIEIDHKIFEIRNGEAFELHNHDFETL